jgi:hypothetical protein
MKHLKYYLYLTACSLLGLSFAHAEEAQAILKNFEIPILSKEGTEKGSLRGATAEFTSMDLIKIHKAFATLKPLGQNRVFQLETLSCVYMKPDNQIESDQPVTIDTKGMIIDGDGLSWNMDTSSLTILRNVTVDIDAKLFKQAGTDE